MRGGGGGKGEPGTHCSRMRPIFQDFLEGSRKMQGELRSGRGLRMRNRPYLAYMYTRSSIAVGIDIIHLDRDWKHARRPIELHYVGLALCMLRSHGRC